MTVKPKRKSARYPELTPGQLYSVIGIEADDYRLLNDRGKPYLYPNRIFVMVDASEPEDWVTETGEGGERYAYPRSLNGRGFFEDFFDGKRKAVSALWRVVNRRLTVAR